MFLSRRERGEAPRAAALTGPVTVPGNTVGAYLEGERREMSLFAPGGYHWVPALGDEVLVLKAGESGERPCVVGCAMEDMELAPGEVLISTGEASIRLSPEGKVAVKGRFTVNGMVIGPEPPKKDDDDDDDDDEDGNENGNENEEES